MSLESPMRIARSFPLLFVGLALGACASSSAQSSAPATPDLPPPTVVELTPAPEQSQAPEQSPAGPASAEATEPEEEPDAEQESGMTNRLGPPDGKGLDGVGKGLERVMGLGTIGTIGGPPAKPASAPPPRIRMGATQITGKLPPEVIQRIVRQHFGRFRHCYSKGLKKDPTLQGRVEVHFVIGPDGKVIRAQGSGDLPDASVVSCVSTAFRALAFPQPEGGIVTVRYPIVFTPAPATGGGDPNPAVIRRRVPARSEEQRCFGVCRAAR